MRTLSNIQVNRLGRCVFPRVLAAMSDPVFAAENERWAQEYLGMTFAEAEKLPIDEISEVVDKWLVSLLGENRELPTVEMVHFNKKEAHAPT